MDTIDKLKEIYNRYRRKYQGNPDSGQMCCMWSTSNPPDDIFSSDQILTIENEFDIEISEDNALEIYDMTINEAVCKIEAIKSAQC